MSAKAASTDVLLTYHRVGLNVTSLKWIGPSLGDIESIPKIPAQLKYGEAAKRCDDIGFSDGKCSAQSDENGCIINGKEPPSDQNQSSIGRDGASSCPGGATPSQDIADRERLQMMMQVSKSAAGYKLSGRSQSQENRLLTHH